MESIQFIVLVALILIALGILYRLGRLEDYLRQRFGATANTEDDDEDIDPLYQAAKQAVIDGRRANPSYLQRRVVYVHRAANSS